MIRHRISPFGQLLREWRNRAGISQIELAVEAQTTPRHLSVIETGRSRPGPELVHGLATALAVPIPGRNALLVRCGLGASLPSPLAR